MPAIPVLRRQRPDPEGRMPLRAHLTELRRRLIVSAVAVVLATVVGWVWLYEPVMNNLIVEPMNARGVQLTYRSVVEPFNIKIRVSVYLGLVLASPVWLWQTWRFITPGLTRKERRYSTYFVASAVPLFAAGVALAVAVFPKAVAFGAEFAVDGTANMPDASGVVTFALRLILALGVAFLLPLFLIALNLVGVLSGQVMGKHWRIAVFISFLFAAIVSPSPDPTQMIVMALPLSGLYALSVLFAVLNDRRRARQAQRLDDEAGAPLAASGPIEAPLPLADLVEPDGQSDADPPAPPGR